MTENNSLDTKILIVDDEPNVRDFLKLFLKFKGYRDVSSADNGRDALAIVKSEDITLLLLDIMLPDLNGVEVLRQVKEMKADAAVIMITGYPDEEKAKELLKQGAYDYIVKPFDLNYLELSVLSKIALAV